MPFTLELFKADDPDPAAVYAFEFTPMVSIGFVTNYNESSAVATISSYREEWRVTQAAFLNVDPEDLATEWEDLIDFIANRDDQVIGARIKNGSTVLHEINTTTHYKFKINEIQMEESPGLNVNHIVFNFKLTATRSLNGSVDSEGGETTSVSKLEQRLEFDYDQGGFLTKTLSGLVRTQGGGAEAAARVLGKLELPSNFFRYVFNGPEGTKVTVNSSPADDEATFLCAVQEQALEYPGDDVTRFNKSEVVKKTRFADYIETTVLVQATTIEAAEAYALEEKPENCESTSISRVLESNTVSVQFYSKTPKVGFLSKRYEYSISGGARPKVVQTVLYGNPVIGLGSIQPVTIEETIKVRAYKDSPALFAAKTALKQENVDDAATTFSIVLANEASTDSKFDEYESVLRLRHVCPPGAAQLAFQAEVSNAFNSVG